MIKKLCSIFSTILFCSIFSTGCFATLYLTAPDLFLSKNELKWQVLEAQIETTKERFITIYWGGYGGYVNMMEDFIRVLGKAKRQGKIITFELMDESYSAHAVAVCYGDVVKNNDQYFLMFHNFADENDRPNADPEVRKHLESLLQPCVADGILTDSDVVKIGKLSEVYVYYKNNHYIRTYKFDRRL